MVEEVLQASVKSGEFDSALDVQVTAGALVGMVVAGALDWQSFHPGRSLEDVRAALSPLLRGGLTRRAG